jgi:hypothetical protein
MTMATSYKELYNSVYSKIKDYDFITMSEDEADEILHDYIRPAIVDFEDCKQDLSDRDETLKSFNIDLMDINFEILSNFMVIKYIEATYINTPMALKAYMSTADFHKYDNKDVLGKVVEVRDGYLKRNKQLMINYSIRSKDSGLAKLYEEKGNYDPSKKSKPITKSGVCNCCSIPEDFTPSHCDYHCSDCGVHRS